MAAKRRNPSSAPASGKPGREAKPGRRTAATPDPASIRCLSIKDPWITMIGRRKKCFELRKRNSHYRGMLVLCSSAARSKTKDAAKWPQYDGEKGVALYVVDMVDCFPAQRKHAKGAGCMPSKGEWVWELRRVRKLSEPVKVKGSLGFYKPTRAVLKQLRNDGFID